MANAQGLGDRYADGGRIRHGAQVDERGTAGEAAGQPACHLQRQAGLADARGARQGDGPDFGAEQ